MKFVDVRPGSERMLPVAPGRSWSRRSVSTLLGIVWHHAAGGDDPYATARYHIAPNHVSPRGMPGLGYAFFIDKAGTVFWANDLEAATWSQGSRDIHPDADGDGDVDVADGKGAANARFLAVCFGGDFFSEHNRDGDEPTGEQMLAGLALVGVLTGRVPDERFPAELHGKLGHVGFGDVWSHASFGKAACPGRTLELLAAAMRESGRRRRSVAEWQRALDDRGHPPGLIDGAWGPKSKAALVAFQRASGLPLTAARDRETERALFGA